MTRPRASLAGLAAGLMILLAQAATLPLLAGRLALAQTQPDFHAALRAKATLLQGAFHLGGTGILLALLMALGWFGTPNERVAPLRRAAGPTLAVLLISLCLWLWCALHGWPGGDLLVLDGGMTGLALGATLPLVSALRLRRAARHVSGRGRRRVVLLYALFALTWSWSLAFGLMQFLVGVSA